MCVMWDDWFSIQFDTYEEEEDSIREEWKKGIHLSSTVAGQVEREKLWLDDLLYWWVKKRK